MSAMTAPAHDPRAWQLAQLNIAALLEPLDAPGLADFVAALEPVNALADAAPGFVWRLQTADGDATAVRGFGDDRIIVNLSVWESLHALADFVYGGDHLDVMRRRRQWFEPMDRAYTVLWWVPAGHFPTVEEAQQRLELLQTEGAGPQAFTFRTAFPPPEPIPPSGSRSGSRSRSRSESASGARSESRSEPATGSTPERPRGSWNCAV
jgi:hypothetical protein